ncbi:MAG: hypothetical protein CRU78_09260 [Candidatus Accumulibacter phosphatis]|uniref:Uncharacterized protein n=1 Tax=Candidatus Accumulibacter phosphatis TaxID=327160 RepID=A0A6A7RTQ1_9PROT|nr:hypothetical protein [Candidatus Accumulibacter phosphatis]
MAKRMEHNRPGAQRLPIGRAARLPAPAALALDDVWLIPGRRCRAPAAGRSADAGNERPPKTDSRRLVTSAGPPS